MNIKVELKNYLKYKGDIANLQGELIEIQEDIGLSGGVSDATGIRSKGFKKSAMEIQAISNITKEKNILGKMEKLKRKMQFVEDIVEALKEERKIIIKSFFIEGRSNRKIADELEITLEAVKKRKRRIIRDMQKNYDKSKNVP